MSPFAIVFNLLNLYVDALSYFFLVILGPFVVILHHFGSDKLYFRFFESLCTHFDSLFKFFCSHLTFFVGFFSSSFCDLIEILTAPLYRSSPPGGPLAPRLEARRPFYYSIHAHFYTSDQIKCSPFSCTPFGFARWGIIWDAKSGFIWTLIPMQELIPKLHTNGNSYFTRLQTRSFCTIEKPGAWVRCNEQEHQIWIIYVMNNTE